jgi:hypothetical protein
MDASSSLPDTGALEPGLPVEQIEHRLVEAAKRHHLEERNIAYWLHEIDLRGLYKERGFSSMGDYAFEVAEIKPRKAQYLVFIASRLTKLPKIRAAFDSGELSWTKAREITSVATPTTEGEWLEKARLLSNRDLEKEVRRHDGRGTGGFATLTISLPVEILDMWNDAHELTERLCGTELEKWQVLESSLAELIATHLPSGEDEPDGGGSETDDENGLGDAERNAIHKRDGWRCAVPWCSARKNLEVHHIVFRSRGGGDEPENLISICRQHHALVHRGICSISGRVGTDLKFERPGLVAEQEQTPDPAPEPDAKPDVTAGDVKSDPQEDDDSWRDDVVADIFDGSRAPRTDVTEHRDVFAEFAERQRERELEERSRRRRKNVRNRQNNAGAHVCAGEPVSREPDTWHDGATSTGSSEASSGF